MLATVNDLQKYMDVRFTNIQQDAVEFVLEGLQSELETYLRRPVEPDEFTETHVLDSNYSAIPDTSFFYNYSLDTTQQQIGLIQPPTTIYLRNSPVISVSELSIVSSTGITLSPQTEGIDYIVRRFGIDVFNGNANDTVTVTYTGGLNGANIKFFKVLILRAATREVQNMHDDVVGVKDLVTRNVAPMMTGFSQDELASVKRYRRHRIVG